jgi:orotate phosphoribosyltransferase
MSDLDRSQLHHLRRAAALGLWRAEAVRINVAEPFTLASGKTSPIYINCRRLISSPAFLGLFTTVAATLVETGALAFDAVAGGETAGIPFAAYLARDTGKPMLYVRKKAKGYGIASKVEGVLPRAQAGRPPRVLLVEDLITDGGSKVAFLDALREAGAVVEDALVLFDRRQGGAETLHQHGARLTSVTDLDTTLTVAEESDLLPLGDLEAVRAYLQES